MPFKYNADGTIVTAEFNGKQHPVFINAKNEEAPFDADGTVATIARINGEAQTNRERAERAEGSLAKVDKKILDDPAKALAAIDTVSKLDTKKLLDAGEVDRVKSEIQQAFQGQLDASKAENEALRSEYHGELLGGAFARSPLIVAGDKQIFNIPADFVQSRFGPQFKVENKKIVAVDSNGNKIYSKTNPGELAGFDEALGIIVEQYPQKDSILKSPGGSGGGSQGGGGGNGGGSGGGGGGAKGDMGGNRDERRSAIGKMFPDLAAQK